MTSQINASTINSNYPVAGQDNDSQGFRDNFSRIKVALTTASNEITTLQANTAKLNDTNNFDGNTIQNVILQNIGTPIKVFQIGGATPTNSESEALDFELDVTLAPYFKVATSTSTSFRVANWPSNGVYSQIRLAVTPSTSSHVTTMTFFPSGEIGSEGAIWKDPSMPMPVNLGTYTNKTTMFDLWTIDAGANVFVKFIGTYTTV